MTRPKLTRGLAYHTGRMLVGLGLLIAALGLVKMALVINQSRSGIETVATIDKAWTERRSVSGESATLNLRWTDDAGNKREAYGVPVTRGVRGKLISGRGLTRTTLRIRYHPANAGNAAVATDNAVVVVENLSDYMADARLLGVAGFLVFAFGSAIALAALARGAAPADGDRRQLLPIE